MEMIRSSKVSTLLVKPPALPFTVLTDWVPTHFWIWSFSVVLALRLLKKNASQVMNSQKLLQTLVKNPFPTLTKSVWLMATSIPLPSGKIKLHFYGRQFRIILELNSKRLCKTMPPSSELVKSLKKVVKLHKKFMMI